MPTRLASAMTADVRTPTSTTCTVRVLPLGQGMENSSWNTGARCVVVAATCGMAMWPLASCCRRIARICIWPTIMRFLKPSGASA